MAQLNVDQTILLASQHQAAGRLDEARALCNQVLAQVPNQPAAMHLLGAIATQVGDHQQAVTLLRQVVAAQPQNPGAHASLGIALAGLKMFEESIACQKQAIALNATYARAHCNLGAALGSTGKFNEAIQALKRAIALQPNYAEALCNLGNVQTDIGKPKEAVETLGRALTLRPNYPEAQYNLANAQAALKQFGLAAASYRKAIEQRPKYANAHGNLANALSHLGRLDSAIAEYRQAITLNPNDPAIHSGLILTLHYHPDSTNATIRQELDRWNQRHAAPLASSIKPHDNDRTPDRRLRIGYVSPDFCRHSVARFMLPILTAHDRSAFEIFCYASVARPDDVTARLKSAADTWHDIAHVPDTQLADRIREDRIDVLVDLALHTGRNRLLAFARKPAPVQMTYLAYCGSSGMTTIDYRLTDPHLDPLEAEDAGYTEASFRLPDSYWCYQPTGDEPAVAGLRAALTGYVTFGCLNNFAKVTQPTLAAWAQILLAVPKSRLIVHTPSPADCPQVGEAMAKGGVDPSRITLAPLLASTDYFAAYNKIDIALDPFPFGGGTTTCDALWMGVPVVSLAGSTGVSRAGLSLLSNVGLPELVATTVEDYVRIATSFANDLPRLSQLRATMRRRMRQSPLMDAPRFTRNLEQLYRDTWKQWCGR